MTLLTGAVLDKQSHYRGFVYDLVPRYRVAPTAKAE